MSDPIRLLVAAALLVAVAVGCGDEGATNPQPDPGGVIMPLEVGNRWGYRVHAFPDTGSPYEYLDSIRITAKDTTDDVISFVANGTDLFTNRSNGLWYFPASSENWSLLFKYPVEVDEVWVTGGAGDYLAGLLSKNVTVETTYGEFTCYKYVREYRYGGGGAQYFYLAPNVGIIKYETLDATNSRLVEQGQLSELSLVE